jgi:L-amino acid N-acyltransferase YncA
MICVMSEQPAPAILVEPMTPAHAAPVLAIYQAGIDSGDATFETAAPSWSRFDASKLPEHRLVARDARGTVLGWAACSATSSRPVYAGVVEDAVYVAAEARGLGVGRALLAALVASTEAAGVWTIRAGVFPENAASMALHRAAGFRVVGTFERVGQQHGRWRDVTLLERRSRVVGWTTGERI